MRPRNVVLLMTRSLVGIKISNILVFRGNGASQYDYDFKIADLGLSNFKPNVAQLNEPSGLDTFGTRAYGK